MSAQEDERRRIAGDIHDDSIQVITAAYLRVELIRHALGDDPHAETLGKLDESASTSIDRLRHMIFELRPAMLDTAALPPPSTSISTSGRARPARPTRSPTGSARSRSRLARTTLYRIAAEALANVRKHARARHVSVDLAHEASGYLLRVADDGVGLGGEREIGPNEHFGVSMMTERASMAGGWCRVESNDPEPGTTVVAWTPASRGEQETVVEGVPAEHERGARDAADSRPDR